MRQFPASNSISYLLIPEVIDYAFSEAFMVLELKKLCEKCSMRLSPGGVAYICSYECTFCRSCADEMNYVCPNCEGELVRRPRRNKPSTSADAPDA